MLTDSVKNKYFKACRTGDVEYLKHLIERGFDVSTKDGEPWHMTGLHHSSREGHTKVMELLIENGADLNTAAKTSMFTPVYLSISFSQSEAALLLISRGADIHVSTNTGVTLLQEAAMKGLSQVVEELIKKKVYINEKDNDDRTALGNICTQFYFQA